MAKARFEPIEWKRGRNTLRGSALITRDRGAPWVIFSHGFTGHRLGPGYLFVRLSRALASAGFSTLRFDFSGCGESDGEFQDMTIDSMSKDLISAVRLVKKRFGPKNISIAAHSLGGMIAALTTPAIQPAGLIMLAPVADPQGLIRRRKTILDAGANTRGFYENGPHEMALTFLRELRSVNPVGTLEESFTGDLLLIQGNSDASISVAESRRYVDATRDAGLAVDYHLLKNADHNFSSVAHFQTIFTTVTTWVKERFL